MPKISELPAATTLDGTELVPFVRSGVAQQTTLSALLGGQQSAVTTLPRLLTAADLGADLNVTSAMDGEVRIPADDSAFPVGFTCSITQLGAGIVTVKRLGGGAVLTDDFNRTASTTGLGTATSGQAWRNERGTVGVSGSGRAYNTTASTPADTSASVDCGLGDVTVQATLAVAGSESGTALLARVTDANNFYMLQCDNPSNAMRLYKRVGGTFTQLGTTATGVITGDGPVIKFTVNGTTLTGFHNGVQVATATDSTFANTITRVGLRFDSTLARWDDLTASPTTTLAQPTVRGNVYRTAGQGAVVGLRKASGGVWVLTGDLQA